MAYKEREIIYILTTEDVNDVARELHLRRPSNKQYKSIRKFVEGAFAYGENSWHSVIAEALAESSVPAAPRKRRAN